MKITTSKTNRYIQVNIQPEGYWSDTIVTIRKGQSWSDDNWELAEISCSSGGTDGTQNSIATAITKAIALKQAAKIARNLDRRYK